MGVATGFAISQVNAYEEVPPVTTRMGGLLEKYADVSRGFRMMKPSAWNIFEGEAGAYDVRFADLVDVAAAVTISTSSYGGTAVDGLGDVDTLGAKLGKSRGALLKQGSRLVEGVVFYDYEFEASNNFHELLSLCVNKGKLWQISAKAPDRIWKKKSDLFKNVVS